MDLSPPEGGPRSPSTKPSGGPDLISRPAQERRHLMNIRAVGRGTFLSTPTSQECRAGILLARQVLHSRPTAPA